MQIFTKDKDPASMQEYKDNHVKYVEGLDRLVPLWSNQPGSSERPVIRGVQAEAGRPSVGSTWGEI